MLRLYKQIEVVFLVTKLKSITVVRRDLQMHKWKQIQGIFSEVQRSYLNLVDLHLNKKKFNMIAKQCSSLRIVANEAGCSYKTVHNVVSSKLHLLPY